MNLKKLDDKDVVFIDQPWTDEERKEFSDFLRNRKTKTGKKNVTPKHSIATKKLAKAS